jgi:hypothetical protein
VLSGGDPFDETTMVDDAHGHGGEVEDDNAAVQKESAKV